MIGVIWVFPNNRCVSPKMDGLKTENPIKMDDLGANPTIFGNIYMPSLRSVLGSLKTKIPITSMAWRCSPGLVLSDQSFLPHQFCNKSSRH